MNYANDSTVHGDFDNAILIRNNQTLKCFKKDSGYYVYTDSENDKMHEYQVKYVFGHYPLQNYLVEFPGGRLQTLALTWNSKDHDWFYMAESVYKNMSVTHANWLHWTNQAQNWNSMCADCHIAKDYDVPAYTHYKAFGQKGKGLVLVAGVKFEVGSGTLCINCHMHGQNFMRVDYRRDHSFRVPRPDLSEKLGTPNACNQCHKDKSNQWAEDNIVKWFGESRHFQYGEAFNEAKTGSPGADVDLRDIFGDSLYSASIRSIALTMLVYNNDTNDNLLIHVLNSREPSIRLAAIKQDEKLSVARMNLAHLYSVMGMPLKAEKQLSLFVKENPVDGAGYYNYGLILSENKKYQQSLASLLKAGERSPENECVDYNIAMLYEFFGEQEKAEK